MKISAAIKVGILTLLSICIFIFGVMWLKGRSISIGEKIEVHFKDIDGMRPGSGVQMMGMRIGQVDEIIPIIDGEDSYIIVRFVVSEPGVEIPYASKISIQQSGIIGEKFIEITPPFPETVFISLEDDFNGVVLEQSMVELFICDKYLNVGRVKKSKIIETSSLPMQQRKSLKTDKTYKIDYVITIPQVEVPIGTKAKLVKADNEDKYSLRLTPPEDIVIKLPDTISKYTVVEPLRMKKFIDVQLEAALALKETNDKINNLFTDQFMNDIRLTFENTKDLSEKASTIVDQVAVIIDSSKEDIKKLIASSTELSENMTVLSTNVNEIVEDPQFKENLIATATSIRTASDELSSLIENSKLQESLLNVNSTSEDVAEVVKYINNLTKDEQFSMKMEETVVNLNEMMIKLSGTADTLEELTVDEKARLKKIIIDSSEASDNMKKFSEKLNKRFLLLRLLF